MTTDSSPAVTEEEPAVKRVLNQLRAPLAFTLLGACGIWLLLVLAQLAIPGEGREFSSRASSAAAVLFGVVPVVLPVLAVLVVMLGRPALDKLRDLVLVTALAEYALMILLALVAVVGTLLSDFASTRGKVESAVYHLAWFALIGIAAFVVLRLFLATRPPKPPPPFANYTPLQEQGFPGQTAHAAQAGLYGQPPAGQAPQPHNGQPGQSAPGQPGQPVPGQYGGGQQQPYQAQQPYGQPQPYAQPGQYGQPASPPQYPAQPPQQVPYSPSQGQYSQQPPGQQPQPAGYGQPTPTSASPRPGSAPSQPAGAPQSGPPAQTGQQPASGPPSYQGQQPASGPPSYQGQQPASGPPSYQGQQPGGYPPVASPFPAAAPTQASPWLGFPDKDEKDNQTQVIPPDLRQQADEARQRAEQERSSGWGQPPQS